MATLLLASTFEGFGNKIDHAEDFSLKDSSVLCIPTAAYAYEAYDWLDGEILPIKTRAKEFREFDINNQSYDDLKAAAKGADIIYVTGGNTYFLIEKMHACQFDKVLQDHFSKQGIYFGCSAGAVAACPRIDFIETMDDPSQANLKDFTGLNLIDFLVMPHLDHSKYGPMAKAIINSIKQESILGLKDDQALLVKDNYWQIL